VTRAILFDTETTGLEPQLGHRVIEIAALELLNDLPTGRHFHALLYPERDIPDDATRIHGITLAQLSDKPRFAEIVGELLGFIGDGPLIAHNAPSTDSACRTHDRHARARQGAVSRHAQQSRCTMPTVRDRPQRPHNTQRPTGLPATR
jgi:DNA polymerase III epsilon subunit-like protein